MREEIRKKWDLPLEQKAALAALSAAFLLGGLIGCLLAALSGGQGAEELSGYLTGYLALALEDGLPGRLWPLLWGQVKYLLAVLVLGLTALGLAGIPILFALRGFFFSFSAACFCRIFGGRGFLPAFFLFGLPALLWVPALFLSGVPGFLSARQLLRRTPGDGRSAMPLGGAWWCRAGLCVGLAVTSGLVEYWVVPVLLRAAARVILSS